MVKPIKKKRPKFPKLSLILGFMGADAYYDPKDCWSMGHWDGVVGG
jgi:hypothetical protein